jgi:GNAT superfamily N-acetyltransferase
MKVFSLQEAPQYRSAFLRLIDAVFPKGSPTQRAVRVDEEFALLLAPENASRNLFIIDESLPKNSFPYWPVVAAASFKPYEFHFKGRPIPMRCAGIGLVVTSPEHQRKGYGYIIQNEIEKRAHDQDGALFTVLWSDLVQFYSKLGYVAAGTEMQWQLDKQDLDLLKKRLNAELPTTGQFHIRPLHNLSATKELYQNFGVGPARNFEDYSGLLDLPNTLSLGAYISDPQHIHPKLVAYAHMGKARDLRDTLHEFVGNPKAFPFLLNALLPHTLSGLRVYHPAESALLPTMEHWIGPGTKNALSFFKVIDGPGLVAWLEAARYMPAGFGIAAGPKGFQLLNRHITFFESTDYGHLLQLFFGPWKISEMEDLPSELKTHARILPTPLPVYFWGFDSV